jgi:hypothetical protein
VTVTIPVGDAALLAVSGAPEYAAFLESKAPLPAMRGVATVLGRVVRSDD